MADSSETGTPAAVPALGAPSRSTRMRVQELFVRGQRCLEKGDYAYAHDLFTQCVAADPAQLVYIQHFRANLAQLHGAGKKSLGLSFPKLGSGKGAVLRAAEKGDWAAAFTAGCQALRKAPGDTAVLCEMAEACGMLDCVEVQLYYLRWALDIAPTDVSINRRAAYVLESIAQFDQAIGCWTRVLQQSPNDEEARAAVSRLSVEKTIDHGGYNPELLRGAADVTLPGVPSVASVAKSGANGEARDSSAAPAAADPLANATPEEREQAYRAAIDAEPSEPSHYRQLADFYASQGRLQDAETLYKKGLAVAGGGDLAMLEKLEETYLRRMQERAAVAVARAKSQPTDSAKKLAAQASAEANHAEVEVFSARASREPQNARLSYELGLRLKRVGKYREAIQPLQASRGEPSKRAEANLMLGECFQQIEQYQLALRSYDAAIESIEGADWSELRKLCHYRAGVLALGMGELDVAQQRLTDLASADFGYRDVAERLDKIARLRKTT